LPRQCCECLLVLCYASCLANLCLVDGYARGQACLGGP
jgi:hypothetical protein